MEKIKVQVTSEHIAIGLASGTYGSTFDCPVAKAIQDAIGWSHDGFAVMVDNNRIEVGPFGFMPSQKVQRFIERFDNDKAVKPFTFWLS